VRNLTVKALADGQIAGKSNHFVPFNDNDQRLRKGSWRLVETGRQMENGLTSKMLSEKDKTLADRQLFLFSNIDLLRSTVSWAGGQVERAMNRSLILWLFRRLPSRH
jgi:hypothetical protein